MTSLLATFSILTQRFGDTDKKHSLHFPLSSLDQGETTEFKGARLSRQQRLPRNFYIPSPYTFSRDRAIAPIVAIYHVFLGCRALVFVATTNFSLN
jgi:hypothetical protein